MKSITIAIDGMGGDHGPKVVVPAVLEALKSHDNLKIILVGKRDTLKRHLKVHRSAESERLKIVHATQKVTNRDLPSQALRGKKDSSMRVAINLVKEGEAQAIVSAGNTGALMATAKFVLKTIPGIDRPAIIAILPSMDGGIVRVLDLGANVDSSAAYLVQFAVMGSVLTAAVGGTPHPSVGLLNIGAEEIKGNEQIKEASKILDTLEEINYLGFVEGDDIYKGVADVVVCDGFVGNVALKTSEGLAVMIMHYMKQAFRHNLLTRISGLAAKHVLKRLAKRIDPSRYNGASLVGLQGTVIKSHGSASVQAYGNAIREAILEVEKDVPQRISQRVESILLQQNKE